MVPEARLELARPERRGILNPLRLPIPPLGQHNNILGFTSRKKTTIHLIYSDNLSVKFPFVFAHLT